MSRIAKIGSVVSALALTVTAFAQRPTDGVNTGVGAGAAGQSGLMLALVAAAIFLGVGVLIGYLIGKATNNK